jgi:hypothetical protein
MRRMQEKTSHFKWGITGHIAHNRSKPTMKHIATFILAFALGIGTANAQRQTFNLPAYFATNVFLDDNTNTPLAVRITAIEQTNTDAWATFPAATNLNLAEFGATNINHLEFDQSPTGSASVARMQWNADTETLRMGLDANVTLDIGQQQAALVRNAESVTISNGTVVYISGATGDKATVKIASYSNDTLSARTIGIAAENITAGSTGYVITRGPIFGQNTSAFTAGDMLYLGAYGNFTTNRPAAPLHGVFIGVVEKVNANAGIIFVAVQNGFELDELHDVNVAANTTNNLIISQGEVWTNMAIGSGLAVSNNQLVVTNVASGINTAEVESIIAATSITNVNTSIFSNIPAQISTATTGVFFYPTNSIGLKLHNVTGPERPAIQFSSGQYTNYFYAQGAVDSWFVQKAGQPALEIYHEGNFSSSSYLTISAANTNYWRITTAPTGATAFGSSGQLAVSGTNIYIYSPNALGVGTARWIRVTGDAAW